MKIQFSFVRNEWRDSMRETTRKPSLFREKQWIDEQEGNKSSEKANIAGFFYYNLEINCIIKADIKVINKLINELMKLINKLINKLIW